MNALRPYRNAAAIREALAAIPERPARRYTLMEVCGGQTHGFLRSGLDVLLRDRIELLHGPGCPVCVTPAETLDSAIALAHRPDTTLCTFGDMLRVPGTHGDLLDVRAAGCDVRVVYSPLDAVRIAKRTPDRRVVFLAVGFETTVPAVAAAVRHARACGADNFALLCAHVRVPPALAAICDAPGAAVDAFIAAGHVCTIMGTAEYEPLCARYRIPIVVAGFEPLDLACAVARATAQLEAGSARVEIQYDRAVRPKGNAAARALIDEVFEVADRPWRGLGTLPNGGFALRSEWAAFDAARIFDLGKPAETPRIDAAKTETTSCRAGEVLRGTLRPPDCAAFATACTPEHPLGAPMVSTEGACAAYYRYQPRAGADGAA